MILECDIGNSFCKWRLLDASGLQQGATETFPYHQGFDKQVSQGVLSAVKKIRVACVAGKKAEEQFQQWIAASVGLSVEFARSANECAGVTNAYSQPARLGVDRWLALIAAFHQVNGPALVVDAGSALTLDLVNAAGCHLGGYIVPGPGLMADSLLRDTGQVRFRSSQKTGAAEFGCSTEQSVYGGIAAASLGAVQVGIEQASRHIPQGFAILLTGGGAQDLLPNMPEKTKWVPDLVLDGLNWVLP